MKIINLIDHPEYIEDVSEILWKQWHYKKDRWLSLENIIKRTKEIFKSSNGLPTTLISLKWNILTWTISFIKSDISERKDLFPFVASFYVKKKYRWLWIWKQLIKSIENIAINNWWNELYLYDDSSIDKLYEKYWYSHLEDDKYNWYVYKIYKKELNK